MAVFSKFAVSVAVVAVGYGEGHCGTASALQMQTSNNGLAHVLENSFRPIDSGPRFLGEDAGVANHETGHSLQRHFAAGAQKHKGHDDKDFRILATKKPALAIPSKDAMQRLAALKEQLTGENLKALAQALPDKQRFHAALKDMKECTEAEKESLWKVWDLLRGAKPEEARQFWETVEVKAQSANKEMFAPDKCNLATIANRLETYLCKMENESGKKDGEKKVVALTPEIRYLPYFLLAVVLTVAGSCGIGYLCTECPLTE